MDAQTFFGYTTGSSVYDSRRHVNILFSSFLDYNLELTGYSDMDTMRQVMTIRQTSEQRAAQIVTTNLLSSQQMEFLRFFKRKYGLSDGEFTTITSCVFLTSRESRSPAGYNKQENMILLAQLMMATAYMRQDQRTIQAFYNRVAQMASGMRGNITRDEFMRLMHTTESACNMYSDILANYNQIESYIRARI